MAVCVTNFLGARDKTKPHNKLTHTHTVNTSTKTTFAALNRVAVVSDMRSRVGGGWFVGGPVRCGDMGFGFVL